MARNAKDGHLTLGLPVAYFDKMEEMYGEPIKSVRSPPKLSKYAEIPKEDEVQLSEEGAKFYRSILGKLAWYSLTVPVLSFQVSFLSCFQSCPYESSLLALRDVIRFAKSFRGFVQAFGVVTDWDSQDNRVMSVVDASWSTRSTAGGLVYCFGSLVKVFSRRIQTICLSSCEAECHALVEGCNESIGIALMFETFLWGLPKRKPNGELERVTGTIPITMYSDSESAKCVSVMAGLLRKVRHLELRMLRLQELMNEGRVLVKFTPGVRNPSDSLTKDGDLLHMNLLIDAIGLERDPKVAMLIDHCENLLDFGQGLNRQAYGKVLECLEKALQGLDLENDAVGSSEISAVKDEVMDEPIEELNSFRAVPRDGITC